MTTQTKDTHMICSPLPLPADLCNDPRKDRDLSTFEYALRNAQTEQPTSALQARRITILATPQDCIPDHGATATGYVRRKLETSWRLMRVLESPWLAELGDDAQPPERAAPPPPKWKRKGKAPRVKKRGKP